MTKRAHGYIRRARARWKRRQRYWDDPPPRIELAMTLAIVAFLLVIAIEWVMALVARYSN